MFKYLIICLTFVLLVSCSKNAINVYPQLEGSWSLAHWCQLDNSNTAYLVINAQGDGEYTYNDYITGGYKYSGKVRIKNDDLFMEGNTVFNILEIKDTVGYIHNPGQPTWCSPDSILVSAILRTHSGRTYYKQ